MAFGLSQAGIFCQAKNGEISPLLKQPQVIQTQLQYTLSDMAGDFCWQNKLDGPLIGGFHEELSSLHQFAGWEVFSGPNS